MEYYRPLFLPQQRLASDMSEAIVHTVPLESNMLEEAHTFFSHVRNFAHKNRDVLVVLGGMATSLYLSRSMLRRELTRLQFNVEVFPYDQLTHTEFEYLDD